MITPTLDLERSLAAQGYDLIAGFDEVGRGALAGPVMVGCAAIWARDLEPRSTNGASPTRSAWPPCARSAKSNANLAYDLEGNRR